ncbi:uncharacterized protein L203_103636 [Cryptococcus depauperatus CBS 7841]|uniref:Uncharacterized protein n=1 Tax=Cryptococcus depauperatus CBS 7841 TaxID=1295531 RepID=A0A1E3IKC7_9TREE|nr:hypothetical protein L203_02766 [Cryptococcus depauperatus CBS 7841]
MTNEKIDPQAVLLSSLPIPRNLRTILLDANYKTVSDVMQLSTDDLSAELALPKSQVTDLLQKIEQWMTSLSSDETRLPQTFQAQVQSSTAADLLSTKLLPRFSTLSTSIDGLINQFGVIPSEEIAFGKSNAKRYIGAVVPGMTIELSGPPGIGKSAIVIALALNSRCGGGSKETKSTGRQQNWDSGEVLIIDTEGAITSERLLKAAANVIRNENSELSPRQLLRGIHVARAHDQVQMVSLLNSISDWLEDNSKVNLVIFDTLSYHFRHPGLDMVSRRRLMDLIRCKQVIGKAAAVNHCAVVVCNQLATKLWTNDNKPANLETGDRALLMPQLGDWWTTAKTLRLIAFRGDPGDEFRYVYASMSGPNKDEPWAAFDIDADGLPCDVTEMI